VNSKKLLSLFFVWVLCVAHAQAAVILQYHHVSDETPPSTSTSPQLFAEHLQYLQDHDFQVMSLPELLQRVQKKQTLPDKAVAITFDDSYRSIFTTAFPLLKKYQYPFTVFINTEPVGRSDSLLRWDDIVAMADAGATIANHTHSHPYLVRRLAQETPAQQRQRIREEIITAEEQIKQHTGQSHKILAYPYGEYDDKLIDLLKSLGFMGIGQHSGAVGTRSDIYRLPRFPMGGSYGKMNDFPLKVSALALPLEGKEKITAAGQPLKDETVRAGDRPQLRLWLEDKAVATALQCYFLGEPMPAKVENKRLTVWPEQALRPGRARYNCTARDADSGRYYWFSQPWLVQDEDGQWQHNN